MQSLSILNQQCILHNIRMSWSNWLLPIPHHSLHSAPSQISFMILMEVCLNSSIYFSIIHTTLWSFLVMKSQPKFTPPYPTLALASIIYTLLTFSAAPLPRFDFFRSYTTITYVTTNHTRNLHFSIYGIRIPSQHSKPPLSSVILSRNSFCDITTIGTHRHLGKILKDIFSFFFKTVWHLDRHSTQANNILPSLSIDFILTPKYSTQANIILPSFSIDFILTPNN